MRHNKAMSGSNENTFGNLQSEERYKKLQRTLKLLMLQQNQKKTCETNNLEPVWPSLSSIHGDNLDTSTGFSVHSSRIGSEVIASSRNMRKVIQSRFKLPEDPQKMTTSSVKQYPLSSDRTEQLLMPPPKSIGLLAHSSRRNSLVNAGISKYNIKTNSTGAGRACTQSVISSIKCSSVSNNTSQVEYEKENYETPTHEVNMQEKPSRIFSRWRPVLNDKGQLIIKGTLECGKIARSKPVIQRLSSTSVQSIFKHIYHLDGNIYDERQELPNYIRGKFFNGFPEDWENVHQVWSNYVAGGCNENFRWPTPVTDSDDDLKSEITDLTSVRNLRKCHYSKRDNKNHSISSQKQLNSSSSKERQPHAFEKSIDHQSSSLQKNFNSSATSKEVIVNKSSSMHDEMKQIPSEHNRSFCCCHCSKETSIKHDDINDEIIENLMEKIKTQQLNSSMVSSAPSTISRITSLKDIIHEDKLKIIIHNLTSKKCSIEYIDKIIEMFDCLKFVVSYQSEDNISFPIETSQICSRSSDNHREYSQRAQENRNHLPESHNTYHTIQKETSVRRILSKNDYDSSTDEYRQKDGKTKLLTRRLRERPLTELRSTETYSSNDSPMIDVNAQNQHISPKKYSHPTDNEYKVQKKKKSPVNYDSSVSFTEDERKSVKISHNTYKSNNRHQHYESSVSITEDEITENTNKRNEAKKTIVQNVNVKLAKTLNDASKRTYETVMDSKNTVDNHHLDRIESIKEVFNDDNGDFPKNTNAENRQKSLDNSPSEKNKKSNKPTIVAIDKVSVNIVPVHKKDNSSPKKSSDARDNPKNAISPKAIQKDLKIELHDIIKDKASRKNVKDSKTDEEEKKGNYGTESNPKSLSSWVPKLVKKTGEHNYGLIFEGKLINEAGHVVTKKLSTDYVVKRINSRVIETADNVFYQLAGDLADTKHTVPKEIQKLCLKGCPGRIHNFCEKWRNMIEQTSPERNQNLNNTAIDMINVPTSSRGRRILPPLSYWTGERLTLKDNTPVYSPGHTQDASISSSLEMSFRRDTSQNSSTKKNTSGCSSMNTSNGNKNNKHDKSAETNSKMKKSSTRIAESASTTRRSTSLKRRSRKELKDDSSDAEEMPRESQVKRRRKKANDLSPAVNQQSPTEVENKKNDSQDRPRRKNETKASQLTATYRLNVPYRADCALSDDQSSIMM